MHLHTDTCAVFYSFELWKVLFFYILYYHFIIIPIVREQVHEILVCFWVHMRMSETVTLSREHIQCFGRWASEMKLVNQQQMSQQQQ